MESIGETIHKHMVDKGLSMRKVADSIEGIGLAQVFRVVHDENYTINTLKQVLEKLDLEIKIVPKKDS